MSTHHQVPASFNLSAVVAGLRESREETHKIRHLGRVRELPSREALEDILAGIFAALFPTHYGRPDLTDESIDYFVGNVLSVALNNQSICSGASRNSCINCE